MATATKDYRAALKRAQSGKKGGGSKDYAAALKRAGIKRAPERKPVRGPSLGAALGVGTTKAPAPKATPKASGLSIVGGVPMGASAGAILKKSVDPKTGAPVPEGTKGAVSPLEYAKNLHIGRRGGFVGNLSGDIVDTLTGLPNAAVLAGKVVASANPVSLANVGLHRAGLPSVGAYARFAEGTARDVAGAGKAVGQDYARRYGPAASALVKGDVGKAGRKFGEAFVEHPGLTALDVGAAVSLAGQAIRGAELGGALAKGGVSNFRRVQRLQRAPTSPRLVRPTREHYIPLGPNAEGVGTRVRIQSRNRLTGTTTYSRNPITRGLQKSAARAGRVVQREIDKTYGQIPSMHFLTSEAKAQRAAGRVAREVGTRSQSDIQALVARETGPYARAAKKLHGRPAEDALALHNEGLLDIPGKTPVQAREAIVAKWKQEAAALKTRGQRTDAIEKNIERVRAIPDEYLSPATAPPKLQRAIGEARTLGPKQEALAVQSKLVQPTTAAERRTLGARMIHGETGAKGGIYEPHITVEARTRTPRMPFLNRGYGRLSGTPTVKPSTGYAARTGDIVLSKHLPTVAFARTAEASRLGQSLKELIGRTAAREGAGGGRLLVGPRALQAARVDPEGWVLVSRRTLLKGVRGGMQDIATAKKLEGAWSPRDYEALAAGGPKDVVAIPKAAYDEWRTGAEGTPKLPVYDPALQAWKGGILALTPRFYVNNIVGNTSQYLVQSGADIKSIRLGLRKKYRAAIEAASPGEVSANLAQEAAGALAKAGVQKGRVQRLVTWGFDLNNRMEQVLRRASYIHGARKAARQEGLLERMSAKDTADALKRIADDARKGDKTAQAVVEQAVSDMQFFLGDYQNFSRVEKVALKRIFPFYSWLRVIGRLTFGLPVRNPIRTQAMVLLTQMGTDTENPADWIRPIWNRGAINLPGGLAISTSGMNPFQTLAGPIAAAGGGGEGGLGLDALTQGLAELGSSSVSPLVSTLAGEIAGRKFFGGDYTAPPGAQGSVSDIFSTLKINPATGQVEYYTPRPNIGEAFLQQAPYAQPLRDIAASMIQRGAKPYDVAGTIPLIMAALGGGGNPADLVRQPKDRGSAKVPIWGTGLGLLGAPTISRDQQAELANYLDMYVRYQKAQRQTARKRAKAASR